MQAEYSKGKLAIDQAWKLKDKSVVRVLTLLQLHCKQNLHEHGLLFQNTNLHHPCCEIKENWNEWKEYKKLIPCW